MVFKKRRVGRRGRRRNANRKRMNVKLALGNPKQKVYYFKRHVNYGTISAAGDGAQINWSTNFILEDVPGYTEFTALFDSYKINAVKIAFLPVYNVSYPVTSASGAPVTTTPALSNTAFLPAFIRTFSVIDYNDDTPLTTADEYREYANCKVRQITKVHSRYIKPKILMDSTNSAVVNPMKNPWINTSVTDIPYLGIKFGSEPLPADSVASGNSMFRVEAKFYMSFKTPK